MDPKLAELEQRVFALEQAAKLTPPGDSKSFLGNLNPFSQGASTSPDESKGFLGSLNPFKGGSRRKSRRSKKSKKSRRSHR